MVLDQKNKYLVWDVLLNGNKMSDEKNLIKEINDEIRQDNYQRIWDKYKKYIFIFISLLLVSVASINFYKNYKVKKIEEQSELFFQSIEYIEEEDYTSLSKSIEDFDNIDQKTKIARPSFGSGLLHSQRATDVSHPASLRIIVATSRSDSTA